MRTALQLAEQFGLRVETRGIDLVRSGSSGWVELEAEPGFCESIPVVRILRRGGGGVAVGKPAVEALLIGENSRVHAEHLDDALEGELKACRVRMTVLAGEAAAAE